MAIAVLMYAILDGYDLGVGMLLPANDQQQRDTMIASIGPFWDANETWLVLAVGILLIAFPAAHNIVLREMYLPAVVMLIGLIIRGVAFDFRAKAITRYQNTWDKLFKLGSYTASLSQGFMLGMYVCGFDYSFQNIVFSLITSIGAVAAYRYIGGAWLVLKTEGELQAVAAVKARQAGWVMIVVFLIICLVNLWINKSVLQRWLELPWWLVIVFPVVCFAPVYLADRYLKDMPSENDKGCWIPFTSAILLFTFCLVGFAISFYPYVIPGKLLASEAVSATKSLTFVFYGVIVVLPVILAYTFMSYRIFKGKTQQLTYY
jgi:cytochrome d ubiquinol oxidase subunit II